MKVRLLGVDTLSKALKQKSSRKRCVRFLWILVRLNGLSLLK